MKNYKLNIKKELTEHLSKYNCSLNDLFILIEMENKSYTLLESFFKNLNSVQKHAVMARLLRKVFIVKNSKNNDLEIFDITDYEITDLGKEIIDKLPENSIENIDLLNALTVSRANKVPKNKQIILELVDFFYEAFPKKTKNLSGNYISSSKADLQTKLESFFKKYDYPKETIIKACKQYLKQQELRNYTHCQSSHYFILKENVSTLAAFCENIDNDDKSSFESFTTQLM